MSDKFNTHCKNCRQRVNYGGSGGSAPVKCQYCGEENSLYSAEKGIHEQLFNAMTESRFSFGDIVSKKSGAEWEGKIVGFYSTELTPIGCAVESSTHTGSVQIYPDAALEYVT